MATLTIRNLDDEIKSKIREQASKNGVSMEEEVRRILKRAVINKSKKDMMTLIWEKFAEKGIDYTEVVEFEVPERNDYETDSEADFSKDFAKVKPV